MKLGLIVRAINTGLGIQTHALARHLNPDKILVVDWKSAKPLQKRLERFPGAMVIQAAPTRGECQQFLEGLDVMMTCETPYSPHMYTEADRMGVKTVNQYNFEFLDRTGPTASLYAAPSLWHYDEVPFKKCHLPVPIETDRFIPTRSDEATRFLHVCGRPAIHDRNGTELLLRALEYVTSKVTVTIKCQEGGYVSSLVPGLRTNKNVTLVTDPGDTPEYPDLYTGHDVLVMPRRFGGLCLPSQEALAAGMPVVMPAISPNEWLPSEWLVPARKTGSFMAKQRIDIYDTDIKALAETIDLFAQEPGFHRVSSETALRMAQELSWDRLRPTYLKTFEELVDA